MYIYKDQPIFTVLFEASALQITIIRYNVMAGLLLVFLI